VPRRTVKDVSFTQNMKGSIMRISIISIIFFFLFSFFFVACGGGDDFVGDGAEGVEGVEEACSRVVETRNFYRGWDYTPSPEEEEVLTLLEEENQCQERWACQRAVEMEKEENLEDCGESFTCIDRAHFSAEREKEACWGD